MSIKYNTWDMPCTKQEHQQICVPSLRKVRYKSQLRKDGAPRFWVSVSLRGYPTHSCFQSTLHPSAVYGHITRLQVFN